MTTLDRAVEIAKIICKMCEEIPPQSPHNKEDHLLAQALLEVVEENSRLRLEKTYNYEGIELHFKEALKEAEEMARYLVESEDSEHAAKWLKRHGTKT